MSDTDVTKPPTNPSAASNGASGAPKAAAAPNNVPAAPAAASTAVQGPGANSPYNQAVQRTLGLSTAARSPVMMYPGGPPAGGGPAPGTIMHINPGGPIQMSPGGPGGGGPIPAPPQAQRGATEIPGQLQRMPSRDTVMADHVGRVLAAPTPNPGPGGETMNPGGSGGGGPIPGGPQPGTIMKMPIAPVTPPATNPGPPPGTIMRTAPPTGGGLVMTPGGGSPGQTGPISAPQRKAVPTTVQTANGQPAIAQQDYSLFQNQLPGQ